MERKALTAVIYEKDPPVARIILNRPERANTKSSAMVWDIDNSLKDAAQDWAIKVVILKGNGKGFCGGHDVRGPAPGVPAYPEFQGGAEKGYRGTFDMFVVPILYLWEFPKPTIAQVHGYAVGGGTYLAWFTDITIASEDAYFQMPLVQGIGEPGGHTMIEPWLFMNWKRAMEYMLTAQTLTAHEALEYGLVNKVVPREKLEEATEEMARVIAQAPISTLMTTKALIKRAWELMGLRIHNQMSHVLCELSHQFPDMKAMSAERAKAGLMPRQWAEQQAARALQK
jgi:enoyl-CoA hydratase/carnithine racemase